MASRRALSSSIPEPNLVRNTSLIGLTVLANCKDDFVLMLAMGSPELFEVGGNAPGLSLKSFAIYVTHELR